MEKNNTVGKEDFQNKVFDWCVECFGQEITHDVTERNHRFLEEALELVQATGATKSESHQLVDYVFNRDIGEVNQELGGVMVTLAALSNAIGLRMEKAADTEVQRLWGKIEKIRAKQAAKPKHSPLPAAAPSSTEAPEPDMTAKEWFEKGAMFTLDFLEPAERETIYKIMDMYALGKTRVVAQLVGDKEREITELKRSILSGLKLEGDKDDRIKELESFVADCSKNWDCDLDGHRYNTGCRKCNAEKLLFK